MSIKNILITEPADPILRQLAIQFLRNPDVRVVCPGKEKGWGEHDLLEVVAIDSEAPRFGDCKAIFVDEVWHTANSLDSREQSRRKTERALLVARKQKAPALHYVSASTVPELRRVALTEAIPGWNRKEQKHLWNEIAVEQSGCKFRIYRVPLNPEELLHSASVWIEFVQILGRFRSEVDDRLPGYFTVHPLHLCLRDEGTLDVARTNDIVQTLVEILSKDTDGIYFNFRTQQPLSIQEYLRVLAKAIGINLEIVPNDEQQNYIDRLFGMRVGDKLRHLRCPARTTQLPAEQVCIILPPFPLQEIIAMCGSKLQCGGAETADWKSRFRYKQVLLPDNTVLNYYVGGEGQKNLVLLNAYGQSFRYWERFIQAIYPQLRIILWVPRGNDGDTIGIKVARPQAAHADDLEKVLQQENIKGCTLLAWCSGPKLALEYYQRYPERVSSMVFVAGSFKGLRQYKALETEYEKNLEPLLETVEKYPETSDVVLEYLKGTLLAQGRQARSLDEVAGMSDSDLKQILSGVNVSLRELVLHPFHAANVVAYAKQMRDFWKHDFTAELHKVEVPVLFLGGDCDRIASQAIAKAVAGMMPRAKYLEVKGGTHYIHYDNWNLLAEVSGQIINSGGKLEFNTVDKLN